MTFMNYTSFYLLVTFSSRILTVPRSLVFFDEQDGWSLVVDYLCIKFKHIWEDVNITNIVTIIGLYWCYWYWYSKNIIYEMIDYWYPYWSLLPDAKANRALEGKPLIAEPLTGSFISPAIINLIIIHQFKDFLVNLKPQGIDLLFFVLGNSLLSSPLPFLLP